MDKACEKVPWLTLPSKKSLNWQLQLSKELMSLQIQWKFRSIKKGRQVIYQTKTKDQRASKIIKSMLLELLITVSTSSIIIHCITMYLAWIACAARMCKLQSAWMSLSPSFSRYGIPYCSTRNVPNINCLFCQPKGLPHACVVVISRKLLQIPQTVSLLNEFTAIIFFTMAALTSTWKLHLFKVWH